MEGRVEGRDLSTSPDCVSESSDKLKVIFASSPLSESYREVLSSMSASSVRLLMNNGDVGCADCKG